MRVFILDEIVVKPGRAADLRQAHREGYAPGAAARGMRLEGSWQSPPGDFGELPATLYYLWSVEDLDGWWKMRLSRKPNGTDERFDKLAFWQSVEPMTLSRKRNILDPLAEG